MGLNAIETYVPWNLHEQVPGKFRWAGMLDLRHFLEVCQDIGLLVLLRPGPYICSEWDLGGLPAFLLADNQMKLRSTYPLFMDSALQYLNEVGDQIRPYIGRPVVAVQIENEYGAFGSEKAYLQTLLAAWDKKSFLHGRVLYFTSDNGGTKTVLNGSQFTPNQKVLKTVNLEHKVKEKIKMLRWMQPHGPAMISEFWMGWFDHWGEIHHTRQIAEVLRNVELVLFDLDASINLYMFFGGTNFGFMSGANLDDNGVYLADVTSYDYDAVIAEWGGSRPEKYGPMRNLVKRFWNHVGDTNMLERMAEPMPKPPIMSGYAGRVALDSSIPLFHVLDILTDNSVLSRHPIPMEALGGDYGFVMYSHNFTSIPSEGSISPFLSIRGVRDFAYVLLDGKVVKTVDRNREVDRDGNAKKIPVPPGTKKLEIIVENRGRINYGKHIHDRKGILGNVTVDGRIIEGFNCITMSFPQDHELLRDVYGRNTISKIAKAMKGSTSHPPMNDASSPPTFFKGQMTINPGSLRAFNGELPGTHCRVYGRGVLWVNGFNVGRFHTGVSGPQRALFVPGALLKEGKNEFLVLHMNMHLAREPPILQLFEDPQLGPTKR